MRTMVACMAVLLWGMGLISSAAASENNSSPAPLTPDITLGNCEDVQTPDNPNGQLGGGLSPASVVQNYWYNQVKEVLPVKDAKVTVLSGPRHGVVLDRKFITELGPYFKYTPEHHFLGQDQITFSIEVAGKHINVVTTLIVVDVAGLHDSPCFKGVKHIGSTTIP